MKKTLFIIALMVSCFQLSAQDPFIGEIRLFAGNFAPVGWQFCDGSLQSIDQNTTLYSVIGTTYGGDGVQTFGLPNLNGRVAIQPGQGPGLSNYTLGQMGGTETTTLSVNQIPAHSHTITVVQPVLADEGTSNVPTTRYPAAIGKNNYTSISTGISATLPATATSTGSGQPINNMQPYLGLNYIICVEGIYPAQN